MNTQFEYELRKRIAEELDRLRSHLETPSTVADYPTYRDLVGQIATLKRIADSWCDDINKLLNER